MVQMQLTTTQTLVYIHIIQDNGQTFTGNIVALTKQPAVFFFKAQNIGKLFQMILEIFQAQNFKLAHKNILYRKIRVMLYIQALLQSVVRNFIHCQVFTLTEQIILNPFSNLQCICQYRIFPCIITFFFVFFLVILSFFL